MNGPFTLNLLIMKICHSNEQNHSYFRCAFGVIFFFCSYVKKVQFRLHDSYTNSNRIVSKPPYEVSETGWGEFEVQIKIHFHDAAAEKPVTVYHGLKLFHSQPGETQMSQTSSALVQGRKTVVSEFFDELVFQV